MTKPFSFDELLLRLRAVRRATLLRGPRSFSVGDLFLDLATREVYRGGVRISLTRTEYSLLERLMRDAGKVVPREVLIAFSGREMGSNTLDAFVRLLRNKVDCDDDNDRRKLIHTVRGVGYVIEFGLAIMRKFPIGARLTLWYLAIFAAAQLFFGVGMWLVLRQDLYRYRRRRLDRPGRGRDQFPEITEEKEYDRRQASGRSLRSLRSGALRRLPANLRRDGNWIFRAPVAGTKSGFGLDAAAAKRASFTKRSAWK
jgi:DNA-binding winged helix-turn-helix (wHTH) protein